MHHYVNSSNEMLRKRGYRLTPQRFMILSVIQEAEEHLSIDQITERVQKRNPYVSLSTIYRTLELLRELGLVREVHLPGEQPHYEPVEGTAHHHLVCRLLLEKKKTKKNKQTYTTTDCDNSNTPSYSYQIIQERIHER